MLVAFMTNASRLPARRIMLAMSRRLSLNRGD
jgi:hypothetical protein